MQLNWSAMAGATIYYVYNTTSGSPVFVSTASASATSYTVTGLTPSTAYTFRVHAADASGVTDSNTTDVSATTLTIVATLQGWNGITATGASTPVTQSGLASASAAVTLSWNATTLNTGVVASYNIFRTTTQGAENYASPLATGISAATRTYTDSTVTNGTTYYYTITPVVSATQILFSAAADSEVKVITPPANMALLHPWAVNLETCTLMGRTATIDRTNDYRCSYVGPTGDGSHYDFNAGVPLFVDTYGVGCNYTYTGSACGNSYGCLGSSGAPAGALGVVGNVYYDRSTANCYLKTASSTWTRANTAGFTAAQVALISSNSPGLPPLAVIDQVKSSNICTQQTVSGYSVTKRLLRHSEQIKAAAWPASFSDATITAYQNGTNLNTTGYCNSNSGSGLTYDALNPPADLETISGTLASGIKSVRTGSTSTKNCVSRYGIQDLVGNVWTWNSDQLNTCSSATHSCQGMTSQLDTANTDWNGFNFDGTAGPGGVGGGTINGFTFSSMSFSSTQFQVVLGLPMVAAAASSWDYLAIGAGVGQFNSAKFHGDYLYLYTDNGNGSPARGSFAGGSWSGGSLSGRFTLHLYYSPAGAYDDIGLRCALPAVP